MASPCPTCGAERGDALYMDAVEAWVYQCPECERVDPAEIPGSDFRKRRRRLYKRQGQFADRIGVNRETVNRWEQSKKPIPDWAWAMLELMEENQKLRRRLERHPASHEQRD